MSFPKQNANYFKATISQWTLNFLLMGEYSINDTELGVLDSKLTSARCVQKFNDSRISNSHHLS
jgi:hypothetical protein